MAQTSWLLAILLFAAILPIGCGNDRSSPAGEPAWNLLLITLDTTRADRLGCYGYPLPTSPNLDRLAARGILFERAVAPAPLTLPTHATILTGLDPNEHGVRNNNAFILDDGFPTVAEILAGRGYATGATLGAFPVDSRFGLAQGFSHYDDAFDPGSRHVGLRMTQRTADDVTTRALDWIRRQGKRPFFHWAHYFDPHFPWEAPEDHASRFPEAYDGEVAFMDAAIGRLLKGLERHGLTEKTWIVVVGDHGESLDEHGELNHAMLIYGATQSVPLIVVPPARWNALPDVAARGKRIGAVVRLKDLAATLLDALGFGDDSFRVNGDGGTLRLEGGGGTLASSSTAGRSLLEIAAGSWEGPGFAYTETLAPALEYGWSELRGIRTERWSYIRAPEPELYDLVADPGELENVHARHPDVAERLARLCSDMMSRDAELDRTPTDRSTVEKLRSLGYAALPERAGPAATGRNPRAMLPVIDRINDARTALGTSRADDAKRILHEALGRDPGNPEAMRLLTRALLVLGDCDGVRKTAAAHLARYPGDTTVLLNSAQASALARDFDGAVATLRQVLAADPNDREAGNLLPRVLVQAGRTDEARAFLDEGLRRDRSSAVPHVRYAFFELFRENHAAAERHAARALSIDPDDAPAHTILGEVCCARPASPAGRPGAIPADALKHFGKALATDPLDSLAAFRIACDHHAVGRTDSARDLYESALVRRPNWPEAHARLADVLWKLEDYGASLRHFAIADRLGFANPGFLVNYGNSLARTGRRDEAILVWKRALAADPEGPLAEKLRRNIEWLSK